MSAVQQIDLDGIRQRYRSLEACLDTFQGGEVEAFVRGMSDYSEVVEYVNRRLMDAHHRLTEGNRSDAIAAVESEPNVLDILQELDSVDAKVRMWGDTCDMLDAKRPPPLLVDIANEIRDQYDVKHQLATELRTHRLLALGGGPLEQRVATMRRMVRLDPDNGPWLQDLTEYERHNQANLQRELGALDRMLNAGVTLPVARRIEAVCAHLEDAGWQEPVDAAIVRQAQVVLARMRKMLARGELAKVVDSLAALRGKSNPRRAQVLLSQWDRLAEQVCISPDDELAVKSQEDRDWCAGIVAQATAMQGLASAMERLSSVCAKPSPLLPGAVRRHRAELQTAYTRVRSAADHAGDPAELERWNQAVGHKVRELSGRVRTFWLTFGTLTALVIVGSAAVAGMVWQRANVARKLVEVVDELDQLWKSGKHEQVAATLDKYADANPWLVDHEKVRDIVDSVDREMQIARKAKVDTEQAIESLKASIDKALAEVDKLEDLKAIDSTSKAAKTAVESALGAVDRGLAAVKAKWGDTRQGAFNSGKDLEGEIDSCRRRSVEPRRTFVNWLTEVRDREVTRIREELRDWRTDDDEDKAFHKKVDSMRERISGVEKFADAKQPGLTELLDGKVEQRQGISEMNAIRRDLDKAADRGAVALLEALESVSGRLPDSLAEQAEVVLSSREHVQAALAWAEVARRWQPRVMGSKESLLPWKKALERTESLPLPYGEDDPFVEQLEPLLACLAEMTQDERKVVDQLEPLEKTLATAVLKPDVLEVVIEGAPYYTTKDQVAERPGYFIDEEKFDEKSSDWNKQIKSLVDEKAAKPSRNVKLAESLRTLVARIKKGDVGLDDGVLQMIETVFAPPAPPTGGSPPDDLLRARLLIIATDIGVGRVFLEEVHALVKLSDDLNAGVGQASWVIYRKPYNTGTVENDQERLEAKSILSRRDTLLQSIRKDVAAKSKELGAMPSFCRSLQHVGWIDTVGEELRLSGLPKAAKDCRGTLYVVIQQEDEGTEWKLEECGTLRDGKAVVRAVKDAPMFARPVFVEEESTGRAKPAGSR